MAVDGYANDIHEVHTEGVPVGPENPRGNAFRAVATQLRSEREAQRLIDPLQRALLAGLQPGRGETPSATRSPTSWCPGDERDAVRRAGVEGSGAGRLREQAPVGTPYAPRERYPAGEYPNQHPGGAGLPEWTRADRSLETADLVSGTRSGAITSPASRTGR